MRCFIPRAVPTVRYAFHRLALSSLCELKALPFDLGGGRKVHLCCVEAAWRLIQAVLCEDAGVLARAVVAASPKDILIEAERGSLRLPVGWQASGSDGGLMHYLQLWAATWAGSEQIYWRAVLVPSFVCIRHNAFLPGKDERLNGLINS